MKLPQDYYPDNDYLCYLLEVMQNHAQNNQILVNYHNNIFQVKRLEYFPNDDGLIVLERETKWVENGFSVAELREILEKYNKNTKNVLFDVGDGSYQPMINLYESSDNVGVVYYTNILVGSEEDASQPNFRPLTLPNNPNIHSLI